MVRVQPARPKRALAVVAAALVAGAGLFAGPGLSGAEVTAVQGLAYNYYTNVSLFGGPSNLRGYGQPAGAPAEAVSPAVECPGGGGANSASDPDGAKATYGPAVIFGGKWPEEAPAAPPSGPLTSSVDCKLGAGGSVTTSTAVTLMPPGSAYPGGAGPGPFIADEVHSTCTAREDGTFTASTRIMGGTLETKYDASTQLPIESEPIPAEPAVNYQRTGTIDHVGDSFRIVFNEQVTNADGSLTVIAAHMYLLGPTAVGDMVVGHARCGVTAAGAQATTTTAPAAGGATTTTVGGAAATTTTVAAGGAQATTTSARVAGAGATRTTRSGVAGTEMARTGSSGGPPVALIGLVLLAAGVAAWLWARRRHSHKGDELPGGAP